MHFWVRAFVQCYLMIFMKMMDFDVSFTVRLRHLWILIATSWWRRSLYICTYNGQTRFNGFQVLRGIVIRNVISGWPYNGLLRVKRIGKYNISPEQGFRPKIARRRNFNGVLFRSTGLPWGSGKSREPGKIGNHWEISIGEGDRKKIISPSRNEIARSFAICRRNVIWSMNESSRNNASHRAQELCTV